MLKWKGTDPNMFQGAIPASSWKELVIAQDTLVRTEKCIPYFG